MVRLLQHSFSHNAVHVGMPLKYNYVRNWTYVINPPSFCIMKNFNWFFYPPSLQRLKLLKLFLLKPNLKNFLSYLSQWSNYHLISHSSWVFCFLYFSSSLCINFKIYKTFIFCKTNSALFVTFYLLYPIFFSAFLNILN